MQPATSFATCLAAAGSDTMAMVMSHPLTTSAMDLPTCIGHIQRRSDPTSAWTCMGMHALAVGSAATITQRPVRRLACGLSAEQGMSMKTTYLGTSFLQRLGLVCAFDKTESVSRPRSGGSCTASITACYEHSTKCWVACWAFHLGCDSILSRHSRP